MNCDPLDSDACCKEIKQICPANSGKGLPTVKGVEVDHSSGDLMRKT